MNKGGKKKLNIFPQSFVPSSSIVMVTICLECGDVGFENAYVYCVKCLKFVVHRYCLPEIPKTYDEFVRWVCDNCEAVSSGSAPQKALFDAQDEICTEHIIITSTLGSNKKSISQLSQGEDENYGRTELMLQPVHENLSSSGDAQLADDNCLSGVEPNADNCLSGVEPHANNDRFRKKNVPTEHEHQSDISQQLDGVEEVKVAADESLQSINLRRKNEDSSSLSGKEQQILPTASDQKRLDGVEEVKVAADESLQSIYLRRKNEDSSPLCGKEQQILPTASDRKRLDGVEEVKVAADESLQSINLRRNTEVSSSLCGKEHQILPTISDQKRFDGESQNDISRHHGENKADKLSESAKFRKNSDTSSPIPDKEKQRPAASNHFPIAYQERFDDDIPPGFEPQSSNSPRTHGLEATKVKDKQVRWSSSPNQFQSGQRRRFSDRSSGSPMHNDERKKHRSSSLVNIAEAVQQRFRGHSSRHTHEERRPMHNPVRERQKERVKEESPIIPSRSNVNEGVSQQTHEGRRRMHNTVSEKDKELAKEELVVSPTRSNVNEEVSLRTHETRRRVHNTPFIDKSSGYSLQVKPVVDPIWRGKFNVVNKKDAKFEGFVAHLSSRACQPVIEEAGLLPVLLQLEMVPKSTVWPMSFQSTKPTDDNIALYFFPMDTRYEKTFDRLVNEMSREELALRATTKNAELLIFSSTELETELWRFKNKYFIWGVFKGKR